MRFATILILAYANLAAAAMTEDETQRLLKSFEPLLLSRAAAEKCLSANSEAMRNFDRNFHDIVEQTLSAVVPLPGEGRSIFVDVPALIKQRYPEVQTAVSRIVQNETCDGESIKSELRTYRLVSQADVTQMTPTVTARMLWDEKSCIRPIYPEEAREMKQAVFGEYSLLLTPDGHVVASKVAKSIGNSLLDGLTISTLSQCHFLPERVFGHPVSAPTWYKISYSWGPPHDGK